MSDQLTDLQARNTELVEENRRLKADDSGLRQAYDGAVAREQMAWKTVAELRANSSPAAMVREFMDRFNQPRADRPTLMERSVRYLRMALLNEEYCEYLDALHSGDLVAIADARADMIYVLYGDSETDGIPLDRVIAEVHRSNMTKTAAGDGKKVAKGPDYEPPRIKEILEGE